MKKLILISLLCLIAISQQGQPQPPCDPNEFAWRNWEQLPPWVQEDWLNVACEEVFFIEQGRAIFYKKFPAFYMVFIQPTSIPSTSRLWFVAMSLEGNGVVDSDLYVYAIGKLVFRTVVWEKDWVLKKSEFYVCESNLYYAPPNVCINKL